MGHPHAHRHGEVLSYLSSPENFAIVEPGVYRSNSIHAVHFPFIKRLTLNTVLYLSPEAPIRAVTQFLEENNIRFVNLGLSAWKPYASWKPISEELIKEALEIVLDKKYHPVMVMCASGVHQTGTLVGCLRRLQNWNMTSLIEEYRRMAGTKARYVNEQFMELFDEDLVTLPKDLPDWFIDQKQMMEEEMREYEKLQRIQKSVEGCSSPSSESIFQISRVPGGVERLTDPTYSVEKAAESSPPFFFNGVGEFSFRECLSDGENGVDIGTTADQSPKSHEDSASPYSKAAVEKSETVDTPPSYKKYYYSRSSPLTTEDRKYKRKIIGKID